MITLKTLPQATEQEVFDQVAKHLLTQKTKSIDNRYCRYRSPEGLRCAAGCLIAEDEYDSRMDNEQVDTSWKYLALTLKMVPDSHIELIEQLQYIHDDSFIEDWVEELRDLSQMRNLSDNVLLQFAEA